MKAAAGTRKFRCREGCARRSRPSCPRLPPGGFLGWRAISAELCATVLVLHTQGELGVLERAATSE
eukprot:7017352-Alexandrium_andersonii.AAC.1